MDNSVEVLPLQYFDLHPSIPHFFAVGRLIRVYLSGTPESLVVDSASIDPIVRQISVDYFRPLHQQIVLSGLNVPSISTVIYAAYVPLDLDLQTGIFFHDHHQFVQFRKRTGQNTMVSL